MSGYRVRGKDYLWEVVRDDGYVVYSGVTEAEARRAAASLNVTRPPAHDRWRALAHDLRTYAQHAPLCSYRPTYPDFPVATCDCGFDAVLDRYDRLGAE